MLKKKNTFIFNVIRTLTVVVVFSGTLMLGGDAGFDRGGRAASAEAPGNAIDDYTEYTVDEGVAAVTKDIDALVKTLPASGAATEKVAATAAAGR